MAMDMATVMVMGMGKNVIHNVVYFQAVQLQCEGNYE